MITSTLLTQPGRNLLDSTEWRERKASETWTVPSRSWYISTAQTFNSHFMMLEIVYVKNWKEKVYRGKYYFPS